jgi:large subunit ribosomal protein L7/L12
MAWDIVRKFKLPGSGGPARKFTEAGEYRVVLQLGGPRPVLVVAVIHKTTGLGFDEAKRLVESAPTVVIEGLSEQSAELVADQLRRVGARALAAPIGEM